MTADDSVCDMINVSYLVINIRCVTMSVSVSVSQSVCPVPYGVSLGVLHGVLQSYMVYHTD